MKPKFLAAAFIGLVISTASADLLRYEPFNYNVGESIQGQVTPDGTTWVQATTAATSPITAVTVGSGNLAVPFSAGSGNSASITGIGNLAGGATRLPLGQTIAANSGGTVYFSFALRIDELTGSTTTTGGFFIGLNNTAGATTTAPGSAAARVQSRIDPNDPTKYNLGIFRNVNASAAALSWGGPMDVGQTLFLVASYECVPGLQNDIARLWINPDSSTFGSTEPFATMMDSTTGTGTDIGIASILLRQSPAPYLTLDELRVGTTWADVTTVPEPSACALFVMGVLGMVFRSRRF